MTAQQPQPFVLAHVRRDQQCPKCGARFRVGDHVIFEIVGARHRLRHTSCQPDAGRASGGVA